MLGALIFAACFPLTVGLFAGIGWVNARRRST